LRGAGIEPSKIALLRAAYETGAPPRFSRELLARRAFRKTPPFHFAKDALTLHFLFQNTKGLLNIVVAHKNLQLTVL
jgi:hypothetical protein